MDSDTKKKVEAKVREILGNADMDTVTELKVRELAAETLGIDLSDNGAKHLVREVVEAYLLSSCVDDHQIRVHGDGKKNTNGNLAVVGVARVNGGGLKIEKNAERLKASECITSGQIPAKESRHDDLKFLCKLSNKKSIAIKRFCRGESSSCGRICIEGWKAGSWVSRYWLAG